MKYEFYLPSKNCIVYNPEGRTVICTLWTPPKYVMNKLSQEDINISDIAIIGGLYGGGLKIMLRNLLYNPQINKVIIFGKDLSESGKHLMSFFNNDGSYLLEKYETYRFEDGQLINLRSICLTGHNVNYHMDELVSLDKFVNPPKIIDLTNKGNVSNSVVSEFRSVFEEQLPLTDDLIRVEVPLPEIVVEQYPSATREHVVSGITIIDTWKKLLTKLYKFGISSTFRGGKSRRELHNVKAVIYYPDYDSEDKMLKHNVSPSMINDYVEELLNPSSPVEGEPYTYGHRLGNYFDKNTTPLERVIGDLKLEGDSRHAYISLWDNNTDIQGDSSPCLVSVFFRRINDEVHLTATFRTHNATNAWVKNVFGLFGILKHVCCKTNTRPRTISVISHSISIDVSDIGNVKEYITDNIQNGYIDVKDPNGYILISTSVESKMIIVQHYDCEDRLLKIYKGDTPQELQNKLYREYVISDIGHAMYVGNQLERAYTCLHNDIEYVQDKSTVHL